MNDSARLVQLVKGTMEHTGSSKRGITLQIQRGTAEVNAASLSHSVMYTQHKINFTKLKLRHLYLTKSDGILFLKLNFAFSFGMQNTTVTSKLRYLQNTITDFHW